MKKLKKYHEQCDVRMFSTVTVGTKWQVVIPQEVRELLNIRPGDTLMVVTKYDKAIWMVKTDDVTELMNYMAKEINN